jgi:hypothetical protein
MPYDIVKRGTKFLVQKQDGSKTFGTHDTREDADKQLAALNIAEHRHAESRTLHLLGALGKAVTEMEGKTEYLVVPVVALMEGVIHAVNAETPEFVPFSTLQKCAESWNGKPITIGHPKGSDGKQCSASEMGIWDAHGIGKIRNARVDVASKKMLMEALIEKDRAKKIHPDMYQRLADGGTEEVSVGAMVISDHKTGKHTNGKPYVGSWTFAEGDHLAFLPGGRGACSVAMGCGTHRAAMRMCEEGFVLDIKAAQAGDAAEEQAELIAYQSMRTVLDGVKGQYEKISELVDALIADETENPAESDDEEAAEEQVETARLDAIRTMAQSLSSALNAVSNATYCQSLSDSPRYMAALAGARHSKGDMAAIQAVHDHSMSLGAVCDRSNYKQLEGNIDGDDAKLKLANLNDDKAKLAKQNDPVQFYIESVRRAAAGAR